MRKIITLVIAAFMATLIANNTTSAREYYEMAYSRSLYGDWYHNVDQCPAFSDRRTFPAHFILNGRGPWNGTMIMKTCTFPYLAGGGPSFSVEGTTDVIRETHGGLRPATYKITVNHIDDLWDTAAISAVVNGKICKPGYLHKEICHKNITVGGIAIGTPVEYLQKCYGQPTNILSDGSWEYYYEGMRFGFIDGLVERIYVYSYSNQKLDASGLGVGNSFEDFDAYYPSSDNRSEGDNTIYRYNMEDGTYLWVNADGSFQLNMYAF